MLAPAMSLDTERASSPGVVICRCRARDVRARYRPRDDSQRAGSGGGGVTFDLTVFPVDRALTYDEAAVAVERASGWRLGFGHDRRLDPFLSAIERRFPGIRLGGPPPPPGRGTPAPGAGGVGLRRVLR